MTRTNNLISPIEVSIDIGGRFTPLKLTLAQESSIEYALKDPSLKRVIEEYEKEHEIVECENLGDESITLGDKRIILGDYGFWFSVYGLESCYNVDTVNLSFQNKEGKQCVHSISVYARGFFRNFSEQVEKDSSYLEESFAGDLVKDHYLRSGKTLDEILLTDEMELYYLHEENVPWVKIKLDAPPNPLKFISQYIPGGVFVFHPAEFLTKKEVDEAVTKYCRYLLGLPFCNLTYVNPPDENEVKAAFEEHQKFKGVKADIKMAAPFLEKLYGTDALSKIDGEIDYGFFKERRCFVKLKDGREVPLEGPNLILINSSEE